MDARSNRQGRSRRPRLVRTYAAAGAGAGRENGGAVTDGLVIALALLAHGMALGFAVVRYAVRVESRLARLETLGELLAQHLRKT